MRGNNKYYLQAFTLMEVLISMVLSSLLIFLIFSGYTFFNTQFFNYRGKIAGTTEQLTYVSVIENDVYNAAKVIYKDENNFSCIRLNKPGINYFIYDEFTVRDNSIKPDTFYVKSDEIIFKFNNTKQSFEDSLIDEISFKVTVLNNKQQINIRKKYGADVLIKW
jgi:hypothetical protein